MVAVSKGIAEVLEEDFKIESNKIKVIYNPIPLLLIKSRAKETLLHPFFEDENIKVVVSTGRLIKSKRIDLLLASLAKVRMKNKYVNLVVLGKGDLLEELGFGNTIEIPGGPNALGCIDKEDVTVQAGTFNAYKLAVLSSPWDLTMNLYYSPDVANIVKILVEYEDSITINGELISTNYEQ